ncbi:hypothetical protein W97_06221 [Coniosporium apollinis CBS 100218]|uniref:Apple domain-containing protein n=1 Tax=Coniosporium apollinis (strain CBS 100218) TaxID=1168221 RepID=R7YYF5_CONA1|nr:uncharacterized protein W97_06221 [Coniosporium apollinis CBS 100218]EON66819.1 hypothetical protein W97_06221 [Coniosporium apollinis CBS 100218]
MAYTAICKKKDCGNFAPWNWSPEVRDPSPSLEKVSLQETRREHAAKLQQEELEKEQERLNEEHDRNAPKMQYEATEYPATQGAESPKLLARQEDQPTIHVVKGACLKEDRACVPEEVRPMNELNRDDYVRVSDVRRNFYDWYGAFKKTHESDAPEPRFRVRDVQTIHIITHECVEGDAVRCIAREVPVGSQLDGKDYVRLEDLAQLWGGKLPTGDSDVLQGPQRPQISGRLAARYARSGRGAARPSKALARRQETTVTRPNYDGYGIKCPFDGDQFFTAPNGENFQIVCGWDHFGRDIKLVHTSSAELCATTCSETEDCLVTSYVPSTGACYMKSSLAPGVANPNIIGQKCVNCNGEQDPASSSVVSSTYVITSTITSAITSTPASSTLVIATSAGYAVIERPEPPVSTVVLEQPAVSTVVLPNPGISTVVLEQPPISTVVLQQPPISTVVLSAPPISTVVLPNPGISTVVLEQPPISTVVLEAPPVSTVVLSAPPISTVVISDPWGTAAETVAAPTTVFTTYVTTFSTSTAAPTLRRRNGGLEIEAAPSNINQLRVGGAVVAEPAAQETGSFGKAIDRIHGVEEAVREAEPAATAGYVALAGVVGILLFLIIRGWRKSRREARGRGRV